MRFRFESRGEGRPAPALFRGGLTPTLSHGGRHRQPVKAQKPAGTAAATPWGPLSTPERTPQRGLTLHATRSVDPEQLSDDAASTLHGRTQPFYGGHEFGLAHACGRLFHGLRRA